MNEILSSNKNMGVIGFTVAIGLLGIVLFFMFKSKRERSTKKESNADDNESSMIGTQDLKFIMSKVDSKASPLDILFSVVSSQAFATQAEKNLTEYEKLKKEKLKKITEEKSKKKEFDLSGLWDDEGDEKETEQEDEIKAKKLEEETQRKSKTQLLLAKGVVDYDVMKIEGVDDEVIGPAWVQQVLEENKKYPFDGMKELSIMKYWRKEKVAWTYEAKTYSDPLAYPPLQRNYVLLLARVNSMLLNEHPLFRTKSQAQLLDSNYYKHSMEFRQKVLIYLEGLVKCAAATRNYDLVKNILHASVIFRVGAYPYNKEKIDWFQNVLKKTYGLTPKISIDKCEFSCEGQNEIITDTLIKASLTMTRHHAEAFLKGKLEIAAKQGIPPQVAVQSYREVWWILVRVKALSLDSDDFNEDDEIPESLQDMVSTFGDITKFFPKKKNDHKLISLWPIAITNATQSKSGTSNVKFSAPSRPGKYRFLIDIISIDFMGSDTCCDDNSGGFVLETNIVSKNDSAKEEKKESNIEGN